MVRRSGKLSWILLGAFKTYLPYLDQFWECFPFQLWCGYARTSDIGSTSWKHACNICYKCCSAKVKHVWTWWLFWHSGSVTSAGASGQTHRSGSGWGREWTRSTGLLKCANSLPTSWNLQMCLPRISNIDDLTAWTKGEFLRVFKIDWTFEASWAFSDPPSNFLMWILIGYAYIMSEKLL